MPAPVGCGTGPRVYFYEWGAVHFELEFQR